MILNNEMQENGKPIVFQFTDCITKKDQTVMQHYEQWYFSMLIVNMVNLHNDLNMN